MVVLKLTKQGKHGSLKVMYTVEGGEDIPEIELNHFEGYRGTHVSAHV
jgi:hypothetical protein